MNAIYGTNRMFYEDTRWFLWKLCVLFITIPLALFWFLMGLFVDLKTNDVPTIIWGPVYYYVCHYAAVGFRSVLPIAIGLGSTRKQSITSFIFIGLAGVAVSLFIINGLEYLLVYLDRKDILSIDIHHIAGFVYTDYQFFNFFLIDLALAFFLFGFSLLLSSIHYLIGFMKMFISVFIISILFIISYYFGMLDPVLKWVMELEPFAVFTMIGGIGILSTFISCLLMLNAPLEKKASRF